MYVDSPDAKVEDTTAGMEVDQGSSGPLSDMVAAPVLTRLWDDVCVVDAAAADVDAPEAKLSSESATPVLQAHPDDDPAHISRLQTVHSSTIHPLAPELKPAIHHLTYDARLLMVALVRQSPYGRGRAFVQDQ